MKAVESGKISEADVDARLDELLELVLDTKAAVEAAPALDADAHHALARRAAGESIVLLKNEGGILPLKAGEKVAVIGDSPRRPGIRAGSSAVNLSRWIPSSTSDRDGLVSAGYARRALSGRAKANDTLKQEAVALAQNANVVLLCMGLDEIKRERGHRPLQHEAGQEPTGPAGSRCRRQPERHRPAQRGFFLWKRGAGGLQGAGLRLPRRSGGRGRSGGRAHRRGCPSGKLAETWVNGYDDSPVKDHCGRGPHRAVREGL